MRINWGTGLFIFFTFFVLTLAFVLYKSRQIDNALVFDDYYAEDIKYQQHFDKMENLRNLGKDLLIKKNSEEQILQIYFPHAPENVITGSVWLYRASDKNADITLPFELKNDTMFVIDIKILKPGKWKMKVNWTCEQIDYYKEEDIYI